MRPSGLGVLAAAIVAGCGVDDSRLAAQRCGANDRCTPDHYCAQGYCVFRECGPTAPCPAGFEFDCVGGLCVVQTCLLPRDCGAGFGCSVDGYCVGDVCRDDDADGFGSGSTCAMPFDCDDTRADVHPGATEGPPGGPSCTDGADNDCDGNADALDTSCQNCTTSAECDDANVCTDDVCSASICTNAPNDGSIPDDGVACTADSCSMGLAVHAPQDAMCADSNPCTADRCDTSAGRCTNVGDDAAIPPPDGIGCTDDLCSASVARYLPNDTRCDDADVCTTDQCSVTLDCLHAPGTGCDDANPCTDDVCDAVAGCLNPVNDALVPPQNSPADCRRETCSGGTVVSRIDDTETPSDGVDCTDDRCSGGAGVFAPNDANCTGARRCVPSAFGPPTGCGNVPSSLTLTCPATALSGGTGTTCDVDLAGTAGQAGLISCAADLGPVTVFRSAFGACSTSGWTVTGTPACPVDATVPGDRDALECDSGRVGPSTMAFSLYRVINASALDRLRLCFDYADLGANGGNDFVSITVDPGTGPVTIFNDPDGPITGADNIWQTVCLDVTTLVPTAAGNPAVAVSLSVLCSTDGQNVYVDNVTMTGWDSTYVSRGTVVGDNFSDCLAAPPSWALTGTATCPVEAGDPLAGAAMIEVDNNPATLTLAADTSVFCDDIWVAFDYGGRGETPDELFTVSYDAGAGFSTVFTDAAGVGPDNTLFAFPLNLSAASAAAAENAALSIRFTLQSIGAQNDLYLDNVLVTGALCSDAGGAVSFGPPIDRGGGLYTVQVTASERGAAHLRCQWDSMSPPIDDKATIVFTP